MVRSDVFCASTVHTLCTNTFEVCRHRKMHAGFKSLSLSGPALGVHHLWSAVPTFSCSGLSSRHDQVVADATYRDLHDVPPGQRPWGLGCQALSGPALPLDRKSVV